MSGEERFQLVDGDGRPAGSATRRECHGDPRLLHAVVHLQIRDRSGRLFLQKRSAAKDLFPGCWDTAVGGHVQAGETVAEALAREAREELGVAPADSAEPVRPLFTYVHGNEVEAEFVHAFGWVSEGPFHPDPAEVAEARFFSRAEIEAGLGRGIFTPNFEQEYGRLLASGFLG